MSVVLPESEVNPPTAMMFGLITLRGVAVGPHATTGKPSAAPQVSPLPARQDNRRCAATQTEKSRFFYHGLPGEKKFVEADDDKATEKST